MEKRTHIAPCWEFEVSPWCLSDSLNALNLYWLVPFTVSLAFYAYGTWETRSAIGKTGLRLCTGRWSSLMPRMVHNAIYTFKASTLLQDGYNVFKNKAFQLIRNDGNVVVLPHSLLEQLSALPGSVAAPHSALEQDLLGPHTGLNLILENRLHHSIVQRKLTPRLPLLTPRLEEELSDAVEAFFPKFEDSGADGWTRFQPYQVLGKISAQLAARALVGPKLCKNKEWLDISVNYTESLFRTIVVLRFFPTWMHTGLRYLLPSYWNGQHYVRAAKSLLGPIIQGLLDRNDRGQWTPAANDAESNVLCWLVDTAKGRDRDAETLAHVEVLLALASVHTTLLRMVNVLYDITANPQYTAELRAEIQQATTPEKGAWTHATYAGLEKMDSVLRESQRMSPPTILGLKRLFKESFTFEDGTHVPRGAYTAMPIYAIENDPRVTTDPAVFDGLRSYRLRQGLDKAKSDALQFSSPAPTVLNFGYGKTACPGRFFASLVVKMVFVKVLSEYDFRFAEGQIRPRNLLAHEFLFCWPWQWMEVRKRRDGVCPF